MAVDVDSGQTMMIVPRKSRSELIFDGGLDDFEQIKAETGADWVFYDDEAVGELQDRFQMSRIHTHDADELVAAFPLLASYDIDDARLRSYIFSARMEKSAKELELLRISAQVTSKAHENVIRSMVPGTTEYETESKFLFECNNCGLRFQSYIPIVGAGKNGAVLHYGMRAHAGALRQHSNKGRTLTAAAAAWPGRAWRAAVANDGPVNDGDIVLIDAAGEYRGYTSDVTRTFPANGVYSSAQRMIYTIVLDAQKAAIAEAGPGVSWSTLTSTANRKLVEGLLYHGILIDGDVDELLNAGVLSYVIRGAGHWLKRKKACAR